jgi:hypothetical protein
MRHDGYGRAGVLMATVFGNLQVKAVFSLHGVQYIKLTKRTAQRLGSDSWFYFGLDERVIK